MAKVKTATATITAFLKTKGLDASEIKDAFAELDAADVDLEKAADVLSKNEQWVAWYNQAIPEVQKAMTERDQLKEKIMKLEAAGFKVTEEQKQAAETPIPGAGGQYVTPEDLKKFKQEIAGASSAVMKALVRTGFKHYDRFGKEPDLDAIEQLMAEGKASTVEDAYRQWSKPMRDEAREKKIQKQIDAGIKKGIQDELSKQGISAPRRRGGDEVEQELLAKSTTAKSYKNMTPDEKRQYDNEVKTGFLNDLVADVTH